MTTSMWKLLLGGLLVTAFATVATSDSRPNPDLESYVLFATQDIRSRGFQADCGNIGVEGDLTLRRSLLGHGGDLAAGRVFVLGQGVSCNVRQLFLHPDAPAGQPCGVPTLFTGPILQPQDAAQQCGFPARFECGKDPAGDVLVDPGETVTLPPGRYRDVRVRGAAGRAGTLLLQGGEYDFCSLRAYRRAQILFDAPATVRIAGDFFRIGDLTLTGPRPNSTVTAADIRFFSNGARVSFRRRSEFHGIVCAPSARLVLDNRVVFEGRAVARSIRTDRFVVVRTPGCIVTTTTTFAPTTTTRPPITTTTTTTTTTTRPRTCGNGLLDPGEECDAALCRGSCSSPDGAFVTSCSGVFLRCAGCRIDRGDCPTTTTTTLRSTTTRPPTTTTSTTATTTSTLAPVATPAEVCGDCIDNDRNGLVDFEDPACCGTGQTFTMSLAKARIGPRGAKSKLSLTSTLARAGLTRVDPTRQDVTLQIRQPQGAELLCAQLPRTAFTRKKTTFRFRDRTATTSTAQGLTKVGIKIRSDGSVRFRARGKQVAIGTTPGGPLQLTVGFRSPDASAAGNRCSKTTRAFRTGRNGSLRAP